jgi:uncharacterized protein YbjT (DUF2867 family)
MSENTGKIALVAGSNGLVGSKLLPVLLSAPEYSRVHALTRRALPTDNPRLANRVVRFDAALDAQLKGLVCHDAFCCLGSTMSTAGSQQAFYAVDHDLTLKFASFALAAGVNRFVIVSSIGADPAAKNFYLRVKGETEKDLERLRFRSLDILQPSMLLGPRRELRLLELVAQPAMRVVSPLLFGQFARYRALDAEVVAAAMHGAARGLRKGVYRYTYGDICKLAANRGA